jgi:hypothetical protein
MTEPPSPTDPYSPPDEAFEAAPPPSWLPPQDHAGGYATPDDTPDPAEVTGPPWPRLVASTVSYTPPRLPRWPIILSVVLLVLQNISPALWNGSTDQSSASPYSFSASDAHFSATFPGKPRRRVVSGNGARTIIYSARPTGASAIQVQYFSVPKTSTFDLRNAPASYAASGGGVLVSRHALTYQGRPAEDATLSFSDGTGHIRAFEIGSSAYLLVGLGSTTASYLGYYRTLLDTFTSTASGKAPSPSLAIAAELRSRMPPAPVGFTVVRSETHRLTASGFNRILSKPGAAAALQYVGGFQTGYRAGVAKHIGVVVFVFGAVPYATSFAADAVRDPSLRTKRDPVLRTGRDFESKTADKSGRYRQGTVATVGSAVMFVLEVDKSSRRPVAVDQVAGTLYDALR